MRTCLDCGVVLCTLLDTRVIQYQYRFNHSGSTYRRAQRFKHLMRLLNGCMIVDPFIVADCKDKTCFEIRSYIYKNHRKLVHYLPSIYRQLSYHLYQIAHHDMEWTLRLFKLYNQTRPKVSFLFLVPIILYQVGIYSELKTFVKQPSEHVLNKYSGIFRSFVKARDLKVSLDDLKKNNLLI